LAKENSAMLPSIHNKDVMIDRSLTDAFRWPRHMTSRRIQNSCLAVNICVCRCLWLLDVYYCKRFTVFLFSLRSLNGIMSICVCGCLWLLAVYCYIFFYSYSLR